MLGRRREVAFSSKWRRGIRGIGGRRRVGPNRQSLWSRAEEHFREEERKEERTSLPFLR
jgi:hypothetical protein